jgi:putative OPT family oligopeptide transporter
MDDPTRQNKDTPAPAQPYISPEIEAREFSFRSLTAGIVFGILFGAANAYLGLRVGLTVSTSIPVAVMTFGLFRLLSKVFGQGSLLEANISQTTGSASSSLASGIIFTVPALFLWGLSPSLYQLAALSLCGGVLGILCMIPLRRFLIVHEHGRLPYPEGTACAKVLVASEQGGARSGHVFLGLGLGIIYKIITSFLKIFKEEVSAGIPLLRKGQIGILATPALLGVGYILGYRISAIMVAGSLISWTVLIPLLAYAGDQLGLPLWPEAERTIAEMSTSQIWSRYIRYVGAGAVAFGGIVTIIRSFPVMIRSFKLGLRQLRGRVDRAAGYPDLPGEDVPRTERELSFKTVGLGMLVIVAALGLIPPILGADTTFTMRLIAAPFIALAGFFFVTVSSRIVGLVGVSSNPTSGMTIVTLLGISTLFVLLGWTDMLGQATALTVGTVVCVAASIAGDTSQDLKTGFLLGATPKKQQIAELIGAATSALAVCGAVIILHHSYGFGSTDLPAPQATLMKTIVEGVLQSGIPWDLVLLGVFIGIVVELCSLPSLPFAVGLYLPVSSMTPIFIGGLLRHIIERRYASNEEELNRRRENGILFSSGLIGGEGLLGVAIALYAFYFGRPGGIGIDLGSPWEDILSLAAFALLGAILLRRCAKR